MNCPVCGKPARYAGKGLRGSAPNYWQDDTWYCSGGYACDLAGVPIWRDDTLETVRDVVEVQRARFERVWWLRDARKRALINQG